MSPGPRVGTKRELIIGVGTKRELIIGVGTKRELMGMRRLLVPWTNLGCRMASVEDESQLGRSSERGAAAVVRTAKVSSGSHGMDVEVVQRESGTQPCIAGVNLASRHVPECDRSQLLLVPRVPS